MGGGGWWSWGHMWDMGGSWPPHRLAGWLLSITQLANTSHIHLDDLAWMVGSSAPFSLHPFLPRIPSGSAGLCYNCDFLYHGHCRAAFSGGIDTID